MSCAIAPSLIVRARQGHLCLLVHNNHLPMLQASSSGGGSTHHETTTKAHECTTCGLAMIMSHQMFTFPGYQHVSIWLIIIYCANYLFLTIHIYRVLIFKIYWMPIQRGKYLALAPKRLMFHNLQVLLVFQVSSYL